MLLNVSNTRHVNVKCTLDTRNKYGHDFIHNFFHGSQTYT